MIAIRNKLKENKTAFFTVKMPGCLQQLNLLSEKILSSLSAMPVIAVMRRIMFGVAAFFAKSMNQSFSVPNFDTGNAFPYYTAHKQKVPALLSGSIPVHSCYINSAGFKDKVKSKFMYAK